MHVYVRESLGRENFINIRMHACMRAKRACARACTHKSTPVHTCNAMQLFMSLWIYAAIYIRRVCSRTALKMCKLVTGHICL